MGEITHIEWTDHTFNPWEGCTKVSPGCAHCYAETRNQRFSGGANWGKGAPRRRTSASNWNLPLKWDKLAARDAHELATTGKVTNEDGAAIAWRRPRVFCASLADWLDDEVPLPWFIDLLDLIRCTPNLDWQLLTKRPENFATRIQDAIEDVSGAAEVMHDEPGDYSHALLAFLQFWTLYPGGEPANVWIGTTVEDQARANERIPLLLQIPTKVRFLSCEPLLESVTLTDLYYAEACANCGDGSWFDGRRNCCSEPMPVELPRIDWVICGGESGPGARPMNPDWARSLRDQCKAAGVPFFFKQWGEYFPVPVADHPVKITRVKIGEETFTEWHDWNNGTLSLRLGKKEIGRSLLDGVEHKEFPV